MIFWIEKNNVATKKFDASAVRGQRRVIDRVSWLVAFAWTWFCSILNLLKLDFAHISYTEFAQHVRRNESFQIEVSTKRHVYKTCLTHVGLLSKGSIIDNDLYMSTNKLKWRLINSLGKFNQTFTFFPNIFSVLFVDWKQSSATCSTKRQDKEKLLPFY